jgi:hypothetical protein
MSRFNFSLQKVAVGAFIAACWIPAYAQQLQGDVSWNGWSFQHNVSGLNDGLSLSAVQFSGRTLIGKISLPVMRVFYDNNACGPYADRLGGVLAPVPWANNATLVKREFTLNGKRWYEIGIRDQIGSYDIYQVYYLSSDGILDAHVYSKGLQCQVNHVHYPNWRIDFDLDGPANNIIERNVAGVYTKLPQEFNAEATSASNHQWQVRNTVTGLTMSVLPGFADFTIPDNNANQSITAFERNTVFGRRYKAAEDVGWTVGPNVQVPFGDNETMADDLIFWYEAYMPHTKAEGAALWHSTGIRMVNNISANPPPPITPDKAEIEPNNTVATAQALERGNTLTGTLANRTDVDYFKITVPPGATAGVRLKPGATADYDLTLLQSNGTRLATSVLGTGEMDSVNWTNTSRSDVVVYAQVFYYSGSLGGYRLEIN